MPTPAAARAVLLDIEGTTTSIDFVYDVLFPFARRELERYVTAAWGRPALRECLGLMRSWCAAQGTPFPAADAPAEAQRAALIAAARAQMDEDRKTTALKALQGHIWADGYASGELRGHVYDDVPSALEGWQAAGVPVAIYSSGSVAAQKLLFGASIYGDLLPLMAGHFDTTTGPKKEAASYARIAAALSLPPGAVTFVTDSLAEAEAARAAGVRAVLSLRPGNPPVPPHDFPTITSLHEVP